MRKLGLVLVLVGASVALQGLAAPVVDGIATIDEYAYVYQDEAIGMTLRWEAVDDVMYMCMEAPGTGWLAISFVPMDGAIYADTVIGYVNDEDQTTYLADQAAPNDAHFSHLDDTELGGEVSFISVAGREEDGRTIIEFSRLLDTGEDTDVTLTDADLTTMLAFHPEADDFTSYHSQWRTAVSINFISGTAGEGGN